MLKKYYKKCDHTINEYVELPQELVNLTKEQVQEKYADWEVIGFEKGKITLYKEFDDMCGEHFKLKVKEGKIVKTDPEAGRSIKKGTTITLYRSKGENKYTVKDYTGQNYIAVQTELESLHGIDVTIEKKDVDTSREYDEQEIVGQSVKKGEKLAKGDSIILYIPNISEVYPDMQSEGWSKDDAEAFATKYSLNITFQEEETTAYEEGKVIRQSRAAGSPIIKNANIIVKIAKKPKETITKDDTTNNSNDTKENISNNEDNTSSDINKNNQSKEDKPNNTLNNNNEPKNNTNNNN